MTLGEVKAHILLVRFFFNLLEPVHSYPLCHRRCMFDPPPPPFQLGTVHRLFVEISSFPSAPDFDVVKPPLDGKAKWAIFVRRAVWRFEKFWKGLEKAVGDSEKGDRERWDEERVLPPLGELSLACLPFSPLS